MAGLRTKEAESSLGDKDSSDENIVPATRSYRKSVLRKDAQKKEQEKLRLAVQEMSGTFKMMQKGFNRLQRSTASGINDEEPMRINVLSRTEENSKRMRRGKHFSLDNHANYEEVPVLVNTVNKLVTRIDTLNHRLEIGKLCLCAHPCSHEHIKSKNGSASRTNIQELAGDWEPNEMKSANHGMQEIIKGAVKINMTDETLHKKPPETNCDSKMLESYQLLPTEQQHGSEEQKMHASIIDKLAGQYQRNDENQPATTTNVDNGPKQLDIREARNKRDSSGEINSSIQPIRIDSLGLKCVKTDPQEDNRKNTIKEDFKHNMSPQFNEKPNFKPNLKKYEHVQSKGWHTKYSSRQKREMTPYANILKIKDKPNTDISFVKTKRSADKNRKQHGGGTTPEPGVSHTAKILTKANAPFMVLTHLPREYWDSIIDETYDTAQKIRTSRSKGFDTIICLDTSMSVAEYWGDILDFFRNLINAIEMAQPMEGGLMEHIAVVTFGHETCALQHFTTNYQEVLTKIHLIDPEGSTPLFWAVGLCRAILFGSAYMPRMRDFRLAPRLLLITDGRPTYKFMTGGLDESVKYDEELEKEDVSTRLISISMMAPLFRVYPVAVGNNCDMIRWQNGKRGIYGDEALSSGEIKLSPRSRPRDDMWPFDPLQYLRNLYPSTNQPSTDDSRRQPLRQEALPPSRGQLSTRELQNPSVLDNENSDSDVTREREALTIENVERCAMPIVDDVTIRNQIRTRKEETRDKETFGGTRYNSCSKTIPEQTEVMKSDTQTAPQIARTYDSTKRRKKKGSNKNADV